MIIDTCSFVPTETALKQWFEVISKNKAYMRVFWKSFAHFAGMQKDAYFDLLDNNSHQVFVDALAARIGEKHSSSVDDFVTRMDEADIGTSVIHNGDYGTFLGVEPLPFEYHAEIARKHPGRFFLLAGIDPLKGARALEDLDRCLDELGYGGMILVPFRHGIDALHESWKPLFKRCQERGAPVWIHSTTNWDPDFPMDISHPRVIDKIAIEYPELKIMAGHGGWPWVLEMAVVAWRHPNVFIEMSAFRARNMKNPDFGFGPLTHFGSGPIKHKIMFGSTWWMLNLPLRDIFEEVRDLAGNDRTYGTWTHDNAARLLGLSS